MEKIVYLVNDRAGLTQRILEEKGLVVVIGDGSFSDELLGQCWALLPGRGKVTKEVLDKAPNLKIIAKQGVGVDRIDVAACTERGICVTNTPYSNYLAVAEHTMALMLAAVKQLYPVSLRFRSETPEYSCGHDFPSQELYGKTLSLIGFGHIGARVAKLANGFDMKICAYVRHPERVVLPDYVTLAESMEEAIRVGDVVSLHVSGTEENRGLFGARQFDLMKPTAIFLNTTRGFVVDEKALFDALTGHKIAGAGIDVFEDEPVKAGNPLLPLENLIATPHTAPNTQESRDRACIDCAEAVLSFHAGERPKYAVNLT